MTLQEYLVKLGWSIDEPSFKKFASAIANTTARTAELGSIAVETAGAIEVMVSRVARKYETLYYVSQRTSQSVRYIQSTQHAFKQIGLSAEEANASIESIASTLRNQPWLKSIFGGATTPQDVASKLGKSGLPYFLQARFAEMIGMDEKTLFHLQRFADVEAAARNNLLRRQREAGLDPDALAKQSANFGRELNRLESSLEIFGDRIAADFISPTTKAVNILSDVVDWLTRADKATNGWISTLGSLAGTAGGLLLVEKILRRILGLGSKTATGGALGFLARRAGAGMSGGIVGGSAAVLSMIKKNDPETKRTLQEMLGPLFYELGLSKSPDLTGTDKGPVAPGQSRTRLEQAAEFFEKAGYDRNAANGIAAALHSESKLDPKSVNEIGMSGIGQWDTNRRNKFKELFNKDVRTATFEEQLQYVLWELQHGDPQAQEAGKRLRAGGMSGRDSAGTFIHLFERPGPQGEASDMSRVGAALSQLTTQSGGGGGNNVTVNSKTTVNVQGGENSTAGEYKRAHQDVNDTLVRNVVGAMR